MAFVANAQASGPVRMVIREILLTAPDDASDASVQPDRICDQAAASLHRHWPDTFAFDTAAPESVRERQRIAMLNIHRREQGLAEMPLPPERPKVSRAKANHATAIEWESGSAEAGGQFTKQLAVLKDKPFRPDAFIALLTGYVGHPQSGTAGIHLAAMREGDSTGVILRVHLSIGDITEAIGADETNLVILAGETVNH